ncbi:MAG: efflux RND transporter periplasmic adaptor subunit [Planctomycetota bacterium]
MNLSEKLQFIAIGAVAGILTTLFFPKIELFKKEETKNTKKAGASQDSISVRTQKIQSEKFRDQVATIGTILSNEEVEIRSEISGRIEKIFFKEGSKIKKGNLLVKIYDAELKAQMLRLHHRQKLLEQQEKRQHQLFDKKLNSQEEFDTAIINVDIIKAEIQILQAQIDKTEIIAPFDGNIGLRYVSEGSYLSPTALITTLQDHSTLKIEFTVPERYAGRIKGEDSILFRVAASSENFPATIYAIEPKIDARTRLLRIRASRSNFENPLLPGAFAQVSVLLKERETILIPSYAVIPDLKGNRVLLYKNGKAEPFRVEVGTRNEDTIEILEGLQNGDILIISALLQLRPGAAVNASDPSTSKK